MGSSSSDFLRVTINGHLVHVPTDYGNNSCPEILEIKVLFPEFYSPMTQIYIGSNSSPSHRSLIESRTSKWSLISLLFETLLWEYDSIIFCYKFEFSGIFKYLTYNS